MTSHICSECGSEIPDDSDFCYRCGALKATALKMDEEGNVYPDSCYKCGAPIQVGQDFCPDCGAPLIRNVTSSRDLKKVGIAIFISVIPGFFDVFGLGHLYLRKYSRAAMFIIMSLILWYFRGYAEYQSSLLSVFLPLGVFVLQLADLSRYLREGVE